MNDIDIINEFCKTKNPTLLSSLSNATKNFFIKSARQAIYKKYTKQDIAFTVLNKLSPDDCIKRCKIDLKPLQLKIVNYFKDHDELFLKWSTGSGKTIAALVVSQCFRDMFPDNKIIVISPVSVLNNFPKEMEKYGWAITNNYEFYTYDKVLNLRKKGKPINCKDALLIIDEVHNLRSQLSLKMHAILDCAKQSKKRLLLSATPFVNYLEDFIPLINLLYGKDLVTLYNRNNKNIIDYHDYKYKFQNTKRLSSKNYEKNIKHNLELIELLLNKKLSYINESKSINYPTFTIHNLLINMTSSYYDKYIKVIIDNENLIHYNAEKDNFIEVKRGIEDDIFYNPKPFYNGARRAVNFINDDYLTFKMETIIPYLNDTKSIIFTNWIEYGIDVLENVLKKYNINYGIISGSTGIGDRNKLVKNYNQNIITTLIITKAGSEGIDLKGVRNVFIIDPVWNSAGIEQIIGRAVRFKSHEHLPKNERHVDIYQLILVEPNITEENLHKSFTGDTILYKIIERKNILEKRVNTLLEELSI